MESLNNVLTDNDKPFAEETFCKALNQSNMQ